MISCLGCITYNEAAVHASVATYGTVVCYSCASEACHIQQVLMLQGRVRFAAQAQPHRRAVVEDMLQAIRDQQAGKAIVILDARSNGQFTGQVSQATLLVAMLACNESMAAQASLWSACMLQHAFWFQASKRCCHSSVSAAFGNSVLPQVSLSIYS